MGTLASHLISHRIRSVQPPIIPVVAELIQANPGTISLGQGVVHYSPPPQAFRKIQECLENGAIHQYGAVHGLPALHLAIANKLLTENSISVNSERNIVVTAGSNMGFVNALLAIADPGDEIILSLPYYFNHEMAITMLGCIPVLLKTGADYQLSIEHVSNAISNNTKAVVTISPNNPTGAVYPRATLQAINKLCRQKGIYHISDEAYENFVYDDNLHFSPAALPCAIEHTISLYTLSKSYGLASWRIGYMVIPEYLFESMKKIQDTILICPPIISQYAALGAIEGGGTYRDDQFKVIIKVRRLVFEKLQELDGIIDTPRAEGAFYVMIKVHTDKDDMQLLKELITHYRVAAIPGSAFGIEKGCFFRIAYGSLQLETVADGMDRLIRGLKALV